MGRRPELTNLQMLAVGGECARIWSELAERSAMAEYHARPCFEDVRPIQERLNSVPVADRALPVNQYWAWTERAEISEILSYTDVTPIRIKRPYGARAKVLDAAIEWCIARYGKTITQRRAQACWDAFSATEKRLQNDLGDR